MTYNLALSFRCTTQGYDICIYGEIITPICLVNICHLSGLIFKSPHASSVTPCGSTFVQLKYSLHVLILLAGLTLLPMASHPSSS